MNLGTNSRHSPPYHDHTSARADGQSPRPWSSMMKPTSRALTTFISGCTAPCVGDVNNSSRQGHHISARHPPATSFSVRVESPARTSLLLAQSGARFHRAAGATSRSARVERRTRVGLSRTREAARARHRLGQSSPGMGDGCQLNTLDGTSCRRYLPVLLMLGAVVIW